MAGGIVKKLLKYEIINENNYPGQGHIINIAKRHTNRRWRQYIPQKQCVIELELVKASLVTWLELKGYGTYILQIIFRDKDKNVITMIKYNFNFSDKQSINQAIACDSVVKYVSVKLINSQINPQRMGLDHFFIKGKVIQTDPQPEQKKQVDFQALIKQQKQKIQQGRQAKNKRNQKKLQKIQKGKNSSIKNETQQEQSQSQQSKQKLKKNDKLSKKDQKKQKKSLKNKQQIKGNQEKQINKNKQEEQKSKSIKIKEQTIVKKQPQKRAKKVNQPSIPINLLSQSQSKQYSNLKQKQSQTLINQNKDIYKSTQILNQPIQNQFQQNNQKQATQEQKKLIKQQLIERLKKKKEQIIKISAQN